MKIDHLYQILNVSKIFKDIINIFKDIYIISIVIKKLIFYHLGIIGYEYAIIKNSDVAQWLACQAHNLKVIGSIPIFAQPGIV